MPWRCTGEYRYSSTLSLTSVLDRGGWLAPRPGPLYSQERYPVTIVQQAGWAPGTVWTGAKDFAATGIRSPDRPARSESLYRLSYPGQPKPTHRFKLPIRNLDCLQWRIPCITENLMHFRTRSLRAPDFRHRSKIMFKSASSCAFGWHVTQLWKYAVRT